MTNVWDPSCLELPTDELLTLGGDSRSLLHTSGLTAYGTTPRVREAVPFGSCTASSPIARVRCAAGALHVELREAARAERLEGQVRRTYEHLREELLAQLNVDPAWGVDIALSPSGTDAELLALLLALGDRRRPLCNVVVGPREVGSGSEVAAAGLHFDAVTPHGQAPSRGAPVASDVAACVEVQTIHLRDEDGHVCSPEELDATTESVVNRAVAQGRRVLLHVVAHSKTGVHAPSLRVVRDLRSTHGEDLVVVVDAAQGRISRKGLASALQSGFLVLLTGSKFYGGPPFSGALLVPGQCDPVARDMPPIPPEFGHYFARWELPPRWGDLGARLPRAYNLGLLLRWGAAAEAFRAYYSVPGSARFAILRRFEENVPREYAGYPWFELDRVEPVQFPQGEERLLESKTTVFPFRVRRQAPGVDGGYLRKADLGRVAGWLNEDVSRFASGATGSLRRVLAAKYHVGQPVFEGCRRHPAVLRIALGAALVTEVGLNPLLGASLEARLEWLDDQVRGVLAKLDWVARHFDQLADQQAIQP